MAHLDEIQHDLLTRVAREIGEFIDKGSELQWRKRREAGESPLELGETLTVWTFPTRTFEALARSKLSGDLADWLEQTDTLYHQIRFRGKPAGFARSFGGKENQGVFHIAASPFALQLNQFFEKIDRNEQKDPFLEKDPVVRLLEIPPFQVAALWLFIESQHESRALIIQSAERYEELNEGRIVSSEQFFAALSAGPILDVI